MALPFRLAIFTLLLVLSQPHASAAAAPARDLLLRLDPESRALVGETRLFWAGGGIIRFSLGPEFSITSAQLDSRPLQAVRREERDGLVWWEMNGGPSPRGLLFVRYRGQLASLEKLDEQQALGELHPLAGPAGTYLPEGGGWYPDFPGRPPTRVRLDLPAGQRGLVPGRLIREAVADGRYQASFAPERDVRTLVLLAGPYEVRQRWLPSSTGGKVRLRTYFHPEIAGMANDYLDAVAMYVDLYSGAIGPYPYGEFSVVSTPLPVGLGFPTLTCLGVDVLRLPFIRATSLGHEVLHSWWGNGVFVDWARGNWSEGLTTFMADYAYTEREGAAAAREMRLAWLQDFAAVPPAHDFPLAAFTARRHGASQVVGYHKAAFLFFMLRDRIGRPAFDGGLRGFWRVERGRSATWTDLRRAFEATSGLDLRPFFEQWLARPGAPRVRIQRVTLEPSSPGYRLRISLTQDQPAYGFRLPLSIKTAAKEELREVEMRAAHETFDLDFSDRPLAVTLDPDFRLFRRLDVAEMPPILRQVMLAPEVGILVAEEDGAVRAAALELAARLLESPAGIIDREAVPPAVPLLVVGLGSNLDAYVDRLGLPSRPPEAIGSGTAQVWAGRQAGRTVVVVSGKSLEALAALRGPLPHYGRQSYLVFEGSRVLRRGAWPARSPEWQVGGD